MGVGDESGGVGDLEAYCRTAEFQMVLAVAEALREEFGVTHMEMPVTPERVWREIAGKRAPVPT